jgi:hypothetical protein
MTPEHAVDVSRIAGAIARELTQSGTPAVVSIGDPAALPVGGTAEIEVKIYETVYKLTVTAPTQEKNEWSFAVTMKKKEDPEPKKVAGFTFNPDTKAWSVFVGVPQIKVNDNFIIEKIAVQLSST